jgi:hypothetical protein
MNGHDGSLIHVDDTAFNAEPTPEEVVATIVSDQLDADIILYNGAIFRDGADSLVKACISRRRRSNVVLILVTQGGDADSAYRIARCLQNGYGHFTLYVSGYCKSAGTLIATGAHELVMSEYGELGPLDVQMSKRDELWESQSGLAVQDTLTTLEHHALETFVHVLLSLKQGSGGAVSLKMATEIATSMTSGLFAPIYGQIDPLHVGEAGRAMNIASQYGGRLFASGKNIGDEALSHIISGYPSHEFVIDREEASGLFYSVRAPTQEERLLVETLGPNALFPVNLVDQAPPIIQFLSPELNDPDTEDNKGPLTGGDHAQSADAAKYEIAGVAQDAHPQPTENGSGERETLEPARIPPDGQERGGG